MLHTTVVVIGGGATGAGVLRDLALRGVDAILLEQGGLAHGTSSRFHGLLHSGGRYAVNDGASARECIEENRILRRIGHQCVEETEGFFALPPEDDPAWAYQWFTACLHAGIPAEEVGVDEALRLEPNLSPRIRRVFRVPDACVDGFRLVLHNAMAARRHGAQVRTYHELVGIEHRGGCVTGVVARDTLNGEEVRIACQCVVNAAGSWAGRVAALAGLEVSVSPDRGTLIVFNHRFTSRVINRLHPGADGDIFVPHGSVTILGTTSTPTDRPDDTTPGTDEVLRLLELGEPLFPRVRSYRILRAFAGTRPLYTPGGAQGRQASRGFHVVDHSAEGLCGMVSVFGGKLTTYRLMAERAVDAVCAQLRVSTPCTTATTPILPEPDGPLLARASRFFPAEGVRLMADRLGDELAAVTDLAAQAESNPLLCECEMISLAEIEHIARQQGTHSLTDIRLRTRLGMGTCQGTFCSVRTVAALAEHAIPLNFTPTEAVRRFLQERWRGLRPALWGVQAREMELNRAVYAGTLNLGNASAGTAPETPNAPGAIPKSPPHAPERPACAMAVTPPAHPPLRGADILVIGAGLAGLMAALAAALRGRSVRIITRGMGSLAISGGCVDVLGYAGGRALASPWEGMDLLPQAHPYRLLGVERVRAALAAFAAIMREQGYPLVAQADEANSWLPSIMGTLKPSYLVPGEIPNLATVKRLLVWSVRGLRDCRPALVAQQLQAGGLAAHITQALAPNPLGKTHRSPTALDLARHVDHPAGQDWLQQALAAHAGHYDALLMPPLCGSRADARILEMARAAAGCPVLEMHSIPPGVGGLRLRDALLRALAAHGVELVENATVLRAECTGAHCTGLVVDASGQERRHLARAVILATGGVLGGGVSLTPEGAREAVFGLPVPLPQDVLARSAPDVFGAHAFSHLGISVDAHLRPAGAGGTLLHNVFLAGRALGGYDFASEKSGHGVALTTGWHAANYTCDALDPVEDSHE